METAGDGPRHALHLGQLLGHVGDQDPREQLHFIGVEVVAALPLVEVREELGQLGGEERVSVEDGTHLVGEFLRRGSIEVRGRVFAEFVQSLVQAA